jgi:hypothetical protein
VNFIKKWIEYISEDFAVDTPLRRILNAHLDELKSTETEEKLAKLIESALNPQQKGMGYYPHTKTPKPVKIRTLGANPLQFLDINALELARQMTIYDFKLLKSIKPKEFLNKLWETNPSEAENFLKFGRRLEKVRTSH